MVKRRRETDSDGANESRTVFVDTSLDTHLALIVSNSDTVSDFKKKIVLEHMQCFPEIENIQIHSLKVKRRENFYHLPDIILVWSALHGVKGSWFLSADASGTPACRLSQITSELGTSNGERMDLMTVDDDGLSSDIKKTRTLAMSLPNGVTEKNVVTGGLTIDKSFEKTTDFQRINYSDENVTEFEPPAKKKRKVSHKEDMYHNTNLKDSNASVHASSQDISRPKTSSVDALTEGQVGMVRNEQQGKLMVSEFSDVRNDECNNREKVVFEGTSVPAPEEKSNLESIQNSQKLLGSDKSKEDGLLESMIPENITANKPESDLAQNVATDHQAGDAVKIPNISAMLMDASAAMGDVNSDVKRKRKKKTKKTPEKIQDTSDMEQIIKGEDVNVGAETHESEEQEGEKEVHLNHDQGGDAVKVPNISAMLIDASSAMGDVNSDSKKKRKKKITKTPEKIQDTSDMEQIIEGENMKVCAETHKIEEQEGEKEVHLNHDHENANVVLGPEITSGTTKKRKKEKKSSRTNLEKLGMEQADDGVSGASDLLPSTDHIPEETDKRQSILNDNGNNVHMKLLDSSSPDADENAADFVALTQNEQTVEKENQIVELNQEEKNIEIKENKDKKVKKKSKKSKHTASDILEKLPIADQKLGLEVLTTVENLISLVNSEQERTSKEKLDETNVTALNNDDLVKPVENKGDGINFKHYFLADQDQDKVGCGEKVKKATKSNAEMKTRKKVKDNGLPSVSISTELQSSLKSVENQETESKPRVRKPSGGRNGESKQNSDQGEVNPNSITGSLPVSRNGVRDSNPSDKILYESSHLKEKNRSLDKSSSEKSESLLKNRGNKKPMWSQNVNSMMAVKTPLKRSLLSKAGALFEDESSSDENGNLHFDATIHTPSDSSSDSSSGDSVGGSDFSQDSTGNESNAKGRSAGGKSTPKLDLSASKDLTMDMILRSSKRFKKTKLIVSRNELEQNESQESEFVPDSLVI